jgi:hypothetical protein
MGIALHYREFHWARTVQGSGAPVKYATLLLSQILQGKLNG